LGDGGPYQKTDAANDKTFIWSPCGQEGMLNVNEIVSVENPDTNKNGEMNVYDATFNFKQEVAIIWQKCGS
jgi:hypothetical protein